MQYKRARLAAVSVVLVAMVAVLASASTSSSLFGTKFQVGQTIQFKVEDSTTWWWGCGSCCDQSVVLGWRVASSAGQTVYSVIHDAPVPSSVWQASWSQTDAAGAAVATGAYTLYVDTSVGTLSRCFTLYDPCNRCYSCDPCARCVCQETTTITNCSCRTTLVFIDSCAGGCFSFPFAFPFFGCSGCGTPCTACSGGCP